MVTKKFSDEFAHGKERLDEIGRRLGAAFGGSKSESSSTGLFAGVSGLIEQLGKLAEEAEQAGGTVNRTGEFKLGSGQHAKGVYGFTVKSALGDRGNEEVRVEPFGNIRKDDQGKLVAVQEIREPVIDVFDEPGRVLIVAEVPGIEEKNVRIEVQDDILTIATENCEPNFRKELLLSASFSPDKLSFKCRNGVLEIELIKEDGRDQK
jgi:HSP20 family protein